MSLRKESTAYWHSCSAEPNRRKCRIWNSHGHVTTLPWLFQTWKFRRFGFFAVCCAWTIHILQQKYIWRSEQEVCMCYPSYNFQSPIPAHL